jgi:hypothetical protein
LHANSACSISSMYERLHAHTDSQCTRSLQITCENPAWHTNC